MKSKLKIIIPLTALLLLGGVYKFALAKPAEKEKTKVEGVVYVLPKEFVVNLADSRYGKFNVALVLDHSQPTAAEAKSEHDAAKPPEGYGTLAQEALIRDIVTDEVSGVESEELVDRAKRKKLKKLIYKKLKKDTDVKVHEVLLTDIAVQ